MDEEAVGREQARALGEALHRAGIELDRLWLHYFRLGGEAAEVEIEAYLHHCLRLPSFERDLLARAANNLIDQLSPPRALYAADVIAPHRARES